MPQPFAWWFQQVAEPWRADCYQQLNHEPEMSCRRQMVYGVLVWPWVAGGVEGIRGGGEIRVSRREPRNR